MTMFAMIATTTRDLCPCQMPKGIWVKTFQRSITSMSKEELEELIWKIDLMLSDTPAMLFTTEESR